MAAKRKVDPFVRCFEVSEPRLHEKGHTIYKVTLKTIKVDALDEDVLETVLWKRFNDFKKLYKAMFTLHKALHRQEEFPPFARSKVFGRFDEQVITERQQSAQDLLNFAGQRNYLVNSPLFKQFLEGGELVTVNPHSDPVLEPVRLGHEDSVSVESDSDISSVTSSTDQLGHDTARIHEPMETKREDGVAQDLGGVWQYRQAVDNISLDDDDLPDDVPNEQSSLGGVPMLDADMAMFDPMHITGMGQAPDLASGTYSNLWLLSALSELNADTIAPSETDSQEETAIPGDTDTMGKAASKNLLDSNEPQLETISQTVASLEPEMVTFPDLPETQVAENLDSNISVGEFDPYKSFSSPTVSCGHGDTYFSLTSNVRVDSSTTPDSPTGDAINIIPSSSSPVPSSDVPANKPSSGTKAVHGVSSPGKTQRKQLMTVELGEKGKYIVDAARQISLAQQCEANGNHHMAFTYYKNCVGILLTGVQGDDNSGRREVVRRKTARYLMKAEEIYNKYLVSKGTPDDNRWDSSMTNRKLAEIGTGQSPTQELTQELDPHVAFLQGPVSEVGNYRVLGIIDCVLLVLEQNTNITYVMKILHKNLTKRPMLNIVPSVCPYVVRLHRFYETETALFLLLQHATGGKLWTYVSGFLNQHQEQLADEVFTAADIYNQPDLPGNIYTGQYLHKSPTVKELVASTVGITDSTPVTILESGNRSELVDGETTSLGDPDLVAPAEVVQSYKELLMGSLDRDFERGKDLSHEWCKNSPERNRRDSDFLSLDSTLDSPAFHKVGRSNTYSTSSDVDDLMKESKQDDDKFEEFLKEAHRPSLENFSINSFDSDSAPGSRFDSTASDYNIQSIPEVSETSPVHSDKLVVGPSPTLEEVFLVSGDHQSELVTVSGRAINRDSGKGHLSHSKLKPLLITSQTCVDKKGGSLGSPVIGLNANVMDSPPDTVVQTQRDPILGLEVTPKGKETVQFMDSFDEPSIYDKETISDTDSNSVTLTMDIEVEQEKTKRRVNLPDPRSPTEERAGFATSHTNDNLRSNVQPNKKSNLNETINTPPNRSSSNNNKQNLLISPTNGKIDTIQSPPIITSPTKSSSLGHVPVLLRSISGERSLDTLRRSRKRTLSGVFEELDLAEEGEREKVHLPEGCVRQWAAELVTAVASLHRLGLICKDLRPDNILLGDRGHILLTYFSQWNCIQASVDPAAIAGLYSAPEVSGVFEVTTACDWWSVGVLLFELLTGKSLVSCYPGGITSHTALVVPEHVSAEAQSLLYELLRFHPSERLGSGIDGADDIRLHPFFASIIWSDLRG